MIDNAFKKAHAEKMIKSFASDFFNKFGVTPIVIYDTDPNLRGALTLADVEDIMNQSLRESWTKGYPYPTISAKIRKRVIVTHRQLYYYYARKEGYGLELIADRIGFDHSSVIHGIRHIENLINSKDKLLLQVIDNIEEKITIKHYKINNGETGSTNDGDVQQNDRSRVES